MTKENAIAEAKREVKKSGVALVAYCDPIGNAEDTSGPWGYAPAGRPLELLARFRDKAQDILIRPR